MTSTYVQETAHCRGIQFLPVNPAYTSQVCPTCGIIGTKGYVVKIDQDSNGQNIFHPLLISDSNWMNNSQVNSCPIDQIHTMTLSDREKKSIIVAATSKNVTIGFYPQRGGTAFRCNNSHCQNYGGVTGRDNIGAWNIATKNSVRWSMCRLKNHVQKLTLALVGLSTDPVPILTEISEWSKEQRIVKLERDLHYLRNQYENLYSLLNPTQYSQWFRSTFSDHSWKFALINLEEFHRWTHQDWQEFVAVLTQINQNNLSPNLKKIEMKDLNALITQFSSLHTQLRTNKEIWVQMCNIPDPSYLPKKE